MRIWKIGYPEENNDWVQMEDVDCLFELEVLNGQPRIDEWGERRLIGIAGTRPPLRSDSPRFSGRALVFSDRAKRCLADVLEGCVEWLPVTFHGESLWVAHVTRIVDCIDYDRAVFLLRESSGEIRGFLEYQFSEDLIRGINCFGIPEERVGLPFVSEAFKRRVEECGLTGLKFKLVWDSELPQGSIVFRTVCV